MQKIFLYFIIILSLIIGLIGCPNNPETGNGSNNDQTEQTQEAKNKATSGLEKDLTVIGKIEDTTCDITLNAENGTFTATQSSRSDEVSYSGEFFYYNGKLQLKVTSKNEQTLSSDEIICLTAEVAQTALTSDEPATFAFETNTVTEYEAAKTEFRAANATTDNGENDTVTFEPSGKQYISSDLKKMITVDGDTSEYPETKKYMDFSQNNMVLFGFLEQFGIPALEYSVNGNTITIDISYEFTTQRDSSPEPFKDTFQGNFTGIISKDGNTISNFSGEMTNMHDSIANSQRVTTKIVVSISQCTFIKNNTTNDTTTTIPSGDVTNVYVGKTYLIEMTHDSTSSALYILTFQSETSCTFSAFGSNSIQFDGSVLSMTDASNDIHQLGTITFDEGYSSLTMVITDGPNGQPIALTGTVYEGQSGNDELIPEGTLSNNFDLAGTRYYCEELTMRQEYMNNQIMQIMQNKYADVLNFRQDNSADAGNLGGYEFTYTEAVNENKVVLTSSYNGYIGALVGTISSDSKTIEISGTLKARMSDTVELFLTYKGTYHKIETELFTLDGMTYTSTSAKLNNAAITDGVVYTLTFGDRDFRLQDNKQEISTNSIYYGVYSNITNTQIYTRRGSSERDYRNYFFDDLNMTISSDKKTVIITANVSTHGQNETLIGEQEITFSLNE